MTTPYIKILIDRINHYDCWIAREKARTATAICWGLEYPQNALNRLQSRRNQAGRTYDLHYKKHNNNQVAPHAGFTLHLRRALKLRDQWNKWDDRLEALRLTPHVDDARKCAQRIVRIRSRFYEEKRLALV